MNIQMPTKQNILQAMKDSIQFEINMIVNPHTEKLFCRIHGIKNAKAAIKLREKALKNLESESSTWD